MTIRINKKTQSALHERGISLLVVLLIGSIILVTAIGISQYATRMAQALRARSDAIQTLYLAESTFECVRYWLNKDYRNFSTIGGNSYAQIVCNGQTINNSAMSYNHGTGIGTFTMNTTPLSGAVKVEVDRTNPGEQLFDGHIRVYSQSAPGTGSKATERFQEYYYRVLYGADIIFLLDRSGSIQDADDRVDRTLGTEWNAMLDAVNDSIRLLSLKVPSPHIGLISFGTDAYDTGRLVSPTGGECLSSGSTNCSSVNWREPDVPLTTTQFGLDGLIDNKGTTGPGMTWDDVPKMNLDYSATNFSLGLAIAGAELMGKYYPHSGEGPLPVGVHANAGSGAFERIVANNQSFAQLPSQATPRDRDDTSFPDVIVVITDGAPNGIMTHIAGTWHESSVMGPPAFNYIDPQPSLYPLGRAKLMRTPTSGSGVLIVDQSGLGVTPYQRCHDGGGTPSSFFPAPLNVNAFPNYAMCNGTMIANKLKADEGITIIGIFIGSDAPLSNEGVWLRDHISSIDSDGEPLFAVVANYEDVREKILYLFERMEIIKSR